MNCDRIAAMYRWMEYLTFGSALQGRRCHFLSKARAEKILVLGDGDGRFLALLAERYPDARIDAVDVSQRMLELARRRTSKGACVRFHQQDALRDPLPSNGYDLIVTHFFLDCFTASELATVVAKISTVALPDARWIISEFHEPDRGWRRFWTRMWVRSLYLAFRLLTGLRAQALPNYSAEMQQHGFALQQQSFARWQLLTSELWQRG